MSDEINNVYLGAAKVMKKKGKGEKKRIYLVIV